MYRNMYRNMYMNIFMYIYMLFFLLSMMRSLSERIAPPGTHAHPEHLDRDDHEYALDAQKEAVSNSQLSLASRWWVRSWSEAASLVCRGSKHRPPNTSIYLTHWKFFLQKWSISFRAHEQKTEKSFVQLCPSHVFHAFSCFETAPCLSDVFLCGCFFWSSDLWRTPEHEIVIVFVEMERHVGKRRQLHSAFTQLQVGRTDLRTWGNSQQSSPICAHIIVAWQCGFATKLCGSTCRHGESNQQNAGDHRTIIEHLFKEWFRSPTQDETRSKHVPFRNAEK